ncbi:hypothetical protein [Notoacmeibacter ruber]|uniref:Uncharacterized protein n=1 Tax=Notoacmeibacter ruber TaxID=2670375 RepID=A0A3L7J9L2_9HYPH|nr:hypothetical protein [Notoacmeibacter ruber]RLQ87373.1 hypothetical protein D8780_03265 [Notoacmeibacter ruber]
MSAERKKPQMRLRKKRGEAIRRIQDCTASTYRVSDRIRAKMSEHASVRGLSLNMLIIDLFDEFLEREEGKGIQQIDPEFARLIYELDDEAHRG